MPKVLNIKKIGGDAARTMIADGSAVYVGRKHNSRKYGAWPASKWGNKFIIGRHGTRDEEFEQYRAWIMQRLELLPELRGKDVICWCAPDPCHGDVLLELANQ
jgi:hypothetical protein